MHFSPFVRVRSLTVLVYNRNLWNFPSMPLGHGTRQPQVPPKSYNQITEIWLSLTAAIWSSNRSNDVCSSLTLHRLILRRKTGQTKRLLIEFLWSQLHRRDANSSGAFPRSSVPQFIFKQKPKLCYIINSLIKDGAYLLLLRIRSAHLQILEFPIASAYLYRDIFARFKTIRKK